MRRPKNPKHGDRMFVVTYVRPEDAARCVTEEGDHDYDLEVSVRRAAWFRDFDEANAYASKVVDAFGRPELDGREYVTHDEHGELPQPYWQCFAEFDVEDEDE